MIEMVTHTRALYISIANHSKNVEQTKVNQAYVDRICTMKKPLCIFHLSLKKGVGHDVVLCSMLQGKCRKEKEHT